MLGHFLVICPVNGPSCVIPFRGNAQWRLSAAHYRQRSVFNHPDFCDLPPAVPSPPPYQLHRDNRLRSHPPHFASTASIPTHHLLSRSKCGGLPPTSSPFILAVSFLSIGMMRIPNLSRTIYRLHV